MPGIGNKATLVTSEVCQKCAKCCKIFEMATDIDTAIRLVWTDSKKKKIKGRDPSFRFPDGVQVKEVVFKMPCKHLESRDGKYWCKFWDKERPDFCNTYPDNLFYNVERWNREKILKILEDARQTCIGLKKVTVDDVVKMLNERRGDEGDD